MQFQSGAKSSERKPAYDLLPIEGLSRGAKRMDLGAASHGPRNYEKGANDPVFLSDRKNHMVEHALKYAQGDRSDDHLGAIIANACMLARLEVLAVEAKTDTNLLQPVQVSDPFIFNEQRYGCPQADGDDGA